MQFSLFHELDVAMFPVAFSVKQKCASLLSNERYTMLKCTLVWLMHLTDNLMLTEYLIFQRHFFLLHPRKGICHIIFFNFSFSIVFGSSFERMNNLNFIRESGEKSWQPHKEALPKHSLVIWSDFRMWVESKTFQCLSYAFLHLHRMQFLSNSSRVRKQF